jgi:hypothetical protein
LPCGTGFRALVPQWAMCAETGASSCLAGQSQRGLLRRARWPTILVVDADAGFRIVRVFVRELGRQPLVHLHAGRIGRITPDGIVTEYLIPSLQLFCKLLLRIVP